MSRFAFKFLDSNKVFLLLLAEVLVLLGLHALPASLWMDVRSVHAMSAHAGECIVLAVDRTISRPFKGHWTVTIRQWDGAGWVPWHTYKGSLRYTPESEYPRPLTLAWWVDLKHCGFLPVGKWQFTTTWDIDPASWIPDKSITMKSNVFEVHE